MKKISESNTLVIITALKTIIETFVGPFLAAYFVESSIQSVALLSKYYMVLYISCLIVTPIVSVLSRHGRMHKVFSVGILFGFFSILFIATMKTGLVKYYYLLAMIYAVGDMMFYYPFNIFITEKVPDTERGKFENSRNIISKATAILIPVLLGSIISSSDFARTAIIILFISTSMIVLSLNMTKVDCKDKLDYRNAFKEIKKNKNARDYLYFELTQGFYILPASFIYPALFFMNSPSNTRLGLVSSVSSLIFLAVQALYMIAKKKYSNSSIVVMKYIPFFFIIPLFIYCVYPNRYTITISYIMFSVFHALYMVPANVRRYSEINAEHDTVGRDEVMVIREIALSIGRIMTMITLFTVINISPDYIPYAFLAIQSIVFINSIFARRIGIDS